ncbi:MAG: hypothetical protein JWQ87_2255 [Candidatus Sulfotelmatobacter sp.]|nr:hypothetical protein [Candidatus Sulfotelmatobacter sp.]
MSTIPLPALGLKPPPQPDMMGDMAKMMQLKSMQQGQQEGALDLQQKQRQMQDQQTIMQVAQAHGGSLLSALPELAGKISAASFIPLQKSIIDTQKSYAEKDKLDLENEKSRADQLLGVITQAKQLPPDQYQQMFPQIAAKAVEIEPRLKNQINPQQPIPQQMLDNVALGFATHSQLATIETQKREAATAQATILKDTAQAGSADAEAANKRAEAEYYKKNGGAPGVPTEAVQMNDWLRKNPGKSPSDFMVWKAKNSPSVLLQGGTGGPAGDPMVDMVGQGRVDLATATQRMAPSAKESFMSALNTKYPQYNQATYGVTKDVQKEFTSGDAAKNLASFNTAIEHAGQLQAAADALDNGNVHGLTKIGQALGYQFGSDKTTNFNVIKSALSGEISKVFKGGQATDAEIRSVQEPFDSANSPAQLKGAIQNAISLMNSKRDALQKQYEAGKEGKPNFGGAPSSGLSVKAPNGKTYSFKDQQSLDNFKKQAGIQ